MAIKGFVYFVACADDFMSLSNLYSSSYYKGRKNGAFPYLTHPEQDEIKRFKMIHIDNSRSEMGE